MSARCGDSITTNAMPSSRARQSARIRSAAATLSATWTAVTSDDIARANPSARSAARSRRATGTITCGTAMRRTRSGDGNTAVSSATSASSCVARRPACGATAQRRVTGMGRALKVRSTRGVAGSGLLGQEAIADARLGRDVARLLWILFELLAKTRYIDMQVVVFVAVLRSPDLLKQHRVGHDPVGMAHERRQQCVLRGGEMQLLALDRDPAVLDVDGEAARAE